MAQLGLNLSLSPFWEEREEAGVGGCNHSLALLEAFWLRIPSFCEQMWVCDKCSIQIRPRNVDSKETNCTCLSLQILWFPQVEETV